jgi:hypothetical protein
MSDLNKESVQKNRVIFMFFRKLISTSFFYILFVLISSIVRVYQGVSDHQNHLGLGLWCIIALPIILIWSLLSTGMDSQITSKNHHVISFLIHFIFLGILLAISFNYVYYLSISLFNIRTVFAFIGVSLFWIIDRLIPSNLLSKEARDFYIHKLWISAAVSIACMIYYFFQYPTLSLVF